MSSPQRKVRSYMKPAAKRTTIQKPQSKRKADPGQMLADGFTRINEARIRKVYPSS